VLEGFGTEYVINFAWSLMFIVHAISGQARDFYLALGFDPSPLEPITLMITLNALKACISQNWTVRSSRGG
jgi:hypothetical protein